MTIRQGIARQKFQQGWIPNGAADTFDITLKSAEELDTTLVIHAVIQRINIEYIASAYLL